MILLLIITILLIMMIMINTLILILIVSMILMPINRKLKAEGPAPLFRTEFSTAGTQSISIVIISSN